jgi:hypothetical protein
MIRQGTHLESKEKSEAGSGIRAMPFCLKACKLIFNNKMGRDLFLGTEYCHTRSTNKDGRDRTAIIHHFESRTVYDRALSKKEHSKYYGVKAKMYPLCQTTVNYQFQEDTRTINGNM